MATRTDTVTAAAFVRSPYQVSLREVALRPIARTEILLDVLACGVCGTDLDNAASRLPEPKPMGHEVVGIVRTVGDLVTHVAPGDQVVLESSSFCGVCDLCRDGRVDLCAKAPNFWGMPTLGFSAAMIAPACSAVPARDIAPLAAVLAEPCGVAVDLVKTAEIGLADRVLVVGAGAIGLMALALARRLTSGPLVAANRRRGRLAAAQGLGADAVVCLEESSLAECGKPYGGFDRVLVTAPPQLIPDSLTAAAYGGIVAFIGFDWGPGGTIPLDTTAMHLRKQQLRSSFAAPAIYFPQTLQLLRSGAVPAEAIVSHTFPLSRLQDAFDLLRASEDARKVVIIPDAHYAQWGKE